jgi:hypothetical protein
MAQIITFVIFGGFGVMMLYVGVTQWRQQKHNLANAVRVDAVITHSAVFTSTSADTDSRLGRSTSTTTHRPDIKFRYRVLGTEYESENLYPTDIVRGYAGADAAAAELAPFPVGTAVRAYVDREQPAKAFLIASRSKGPIVFIMIGLLLPPLAWFIGGYV